MHRIFLAAIGSVFEPHGFVPPAPTLDVFANNHLHVQATGSSMVATQNGSTLGYGAAIARGGDWFLCSLFVSPQAHGRGVGSALLDAVWGDHARRRTITDAIQPISNAPYGRRGLLPQAPLLTFAGTPRARSTNDEASTDLASVDRASYGFDRSVDHAYWSRHAQRTTWPGAYSYVFPNGAIGPIGGESGEAA